MIRLYDLRASGDFHRPQVEHVDVWVIGHDGYNNYRIPSLCTTAEGTILAFAEARNPGREHGNVDVVRKWDAEQTRAVQLVSFLQQSLVCLLTDELPLSLIK